MSMRKDRLYCQIIDREFSLSKEDLHKITAVLRKRRGDKLFIFDGRGREYEVFIEDINKKNIVFSSPVLTGQADKPRINITAAFSVIRPNKIDFLLQKCTELGADIFLPFISEYSNFSTISSSKEEHYRKVIEESAAQCGRLWMPDLRECTDLSRLISGASEYDIVLYAHPYTDNTVFYIEKLRNLKSGSVLLIIGPEGGFSAEESLKLESCSNVIPVKISDFILRAETAALFLTGLVRGVINRNL